MQELLSASDFQKLVNHLSSEYEINIEDEENNGKDLEDLLLSVVIKADYDHRLNQYLPEALIEYKEENDYPHSAGLEIFADTNGEFSEEKAQEFKKQLEAKAQRSWISEPPDYVKLKLAMLAANVIYGAGLSMSGYGIATTKLASTFYNLSHFFESILENEGLTFDKNSRELLVTLGREGVMGLARINDDRGWRRKKPGYFREVFLKSTGHVLLCEKLAQEKVLFSFEIPTIIPNDREFSKRQYRRIDLLVVKDGKAVFIEIDGKQHYDHELFDDYRVQEQREDDNLRDRLLRRHWPKSMRITHEEIMRNVDEVFEMIMQQLDPHTGNI